MYSLGAYGAMLSDPERMGAYERAIRQTVKPGSVVVDIGTGTGIMAVLACQLGASRVYAIEPNPIISLAREIAVANHCADKIVFMEEISTQVTLPTRADVIVSDLRGLLPLLNHHIPSIADARRRFLAPGGTMIGPFTNDSAVHRDLFTNGNQTPSSSPPPTTNKAPTGDRAGTAIEGGRIEKLRAGDIVLIPAGVNHMWLAIDKPIVYLDIKFPKAE